MQFKVVITGYCSGLGRALADRCSEDSWAVSGWDWAENPEHNLALDSVMDQVIADCEDAWCFINNCEVRQDEYLKRVFDSWRDQQRLILNIGSCITYFWTYEQAAQLYANDPDLAIYYKKKERLDQTHLRLHQEVFTQGLNGPAMLMFRPCWMNTDQHSERDVHKLDTRDVAEHIFQAIGSIERLVHLDSVITKGKPWTF